MRKPLMSCPNLLVVPSHFKITVNVCCVLARVKVNCRVNHI